MASLLIGIAGGIAAGKTTLSQVLKSAFQKDEVTRIRHDYYYYDKKFFPGVEDRFSFDHPDCFETDLLVIHLKKLLNGEAIDRPVYCYKTNQRLEQRKLIYPSPIIIVEGLLLFYYPQLRDLFNLKIYVDTDADIRLLQLISRDIKERGRSFESVKNQYLTVVKPMHEKFVEPTKYYADIIIPNGGLNEIANDLIISKIKSHLYSG